MFRAWDKNHKCFWYELPIGFELKIDGKIFLYGIPTEEIILVRKTGLQDVSGKDIYEGDIVSCEYCGKKYTDIVKWNDEIIGYDPFCTPCDYDESYYPKNKIIIIGNIYENPELLERGRVVKQSS